MNNETATDLEKALLVLGGFECSKCGKPFRETVIPKKGEKGYQKGRPPEGYDGHICCKTPHCPFCATPATTHCPHLLAHRTGDKHWVFPGMALQIGMPSEDREIDQVWQLLHPTTEEAETYFDDFAPLIERFYDPNTNPQVVLSETLMQKCHWTNTQAIRLNFQGWRYHAFAKDAEEQRASVKATINHVREQVRQWKQNAQSRAMARARFLTPPRPLDLPNITFDSTGRYLLSHQNWEVVLWDTRSDESGREIRLLSREGKQIFGNTTYDALAFRVQPEIPACQLRFTVHVPTYRETDWGQIGETVYHIEQNTELKYGHSTIQEKEQRGTDAIEENWTIVPSNATAPQNHIVLQADKRTIQITPRTVEGNNRKEAYAFRNEITNLQVSPDGTRLALLVSGRVIFWELSP